VGTSGGDGNPGSILGDWYRKVNKAGGDLRTRSYGRLLAGLKALA